MTKERVDLINKESRAKIAWEVFKVGGITFAITAIAPIVFTILFLIEYWEQIQTWTFTLNIYGEIYAGKAFGDVIFSWLMICLPLTIANTIGKRLMYTNMKKGAIVIIVIIALGLVIIFFFIGTWITQGVSKTWV